jgi:hypothetical protein
MIEIENAGTDGFMEIRMTAPITDSDYSDTLVPAIDAAITGTDSLRLLVIVEAGISDFTLGAMMQDARTGLKHWHGFDRIAIATDTAALRRTIGAFSVFMPCPVAVFPMSGADEARRWLRESLGTIHQEDMGGGMLHIRLRGKLDTQSYENEIEDLNRFMQEHDKVRLMIDLRDFDGWQGLGALRDHFALVRGHAAKVARAAIVGDAGWQGMAAQIGKRAFGFDARHYHSDALEVAKAWLASD